MFQQQIEHGSDSLSGMNKNDKDESVTRSYIIGGIGVIALISALILSWFLDTDTFDKGDGAPEIIASGQQAEISSETGSVTETDKPLQKSDQKLSETAPSVSAEMPIQTETQNSASDTGLGQQTDPNLTSQSVKTDELQSSESEKEGADKAKEIASVKEAEQTDAALSAVEPDVDAAVEEITFDVVRISPEGNAVLAGKSGRNQKLELYDGDNLLGTTESDEQGNWVFVPQDPLSVGQHHIVLKKRVDAETLLDTGTDVLAVTIEAPKANKEDQKPLAMLLPQAPDKAVKLVQSPVENETPSPVKPVPAKTEATDTKTTISESPKSSETAAPTALPKQRVFPLVILQLDVLADGQWQIQGTGMGKSRIRYYLDDEYLSDLIIPDSGQSIEQGRPAQWSLSGNKALTKGKHILRLDVVAGDDGKVTERQEIQLSYQPSVPKLAIPETAKLGDPADIKPEQKSAQNKDITALESVKPGNGPKAPVQPPAQTQIPSPVQKNLAPETEKTDISGRDTGISAEQNVPTAAQIANLRAQLPDGEEADLSAVRVINIRTGDNLWTIARQTYGQGIAYTYIFNANQRQIQDPDLIYPGQIFVLPVLQEQP